MAHPSSPTRPTLCCPRAMRWPAQRRRKTRRLERGTPKPTKSSTGKTAGTPPPPNRHRTASRTIRTVRRSRTVPSVKISGRQSHHQVFQRPSGPERRQRTNDSQRFGRAQAIQRLGRPAGQRPHRPGGQSVFAVKTLPGVVATMAERLGPQAAADLVKATIARARDKKQTDALGFLNNLFDIATEQATITDGADGGRSAQSRPARLHQDHSRHAGIGQGAWPQRRSAQRAQGRARQMGQRAHRRAETKSPDVAIVQGQGRRVAEPGRSGRLDWHGRTGERSGLQLRKPARTHRKAHRRSRQGQAAPRTARRRTHLI